MLAFDQLIGQPTAIKILKSALPPEGKPASSYLFLGPDGVGKKTAALTWANSLFCKGLNVGQPCGVCGPCVKIEHGNFPDLHLLQPEIRDKKVKEEIDITHVRELIHKLSFKPYEAAEKVAIIDGADRMNVSAANAFLKTLEEPPDHTTIIMLASNLEALLPTIVSRCQTVRFGPVGFAEMVDFLMRRDGMDRKEAQTWAALSKGAPGLAGPEILEDDRKLRDEAMEMLLGLHETPVGNIFRFAREMDKVANRKKADRLLPLIQELIRDMAVVKIIRKYDNLINIDIASAIEEAARRFSLRKLLHAENLVSEMTGARKWNINPLLVFSLLLLELKD